MKSPFPGMDPYLEEHWGDVHSSLMVYARKQINGLLPDDLQARVEEAVSVVEDDGSQRTVYPDVLVAERRGDPPANVVESSVAVAEPYVVALDEPRTSRRLEIVDRRSEGRIVTVIEVLGSGNKIGLLGPLKYLRKQQDYLRAGVNLVEINLIRAGQHVLAVPEEQLPPECRTAYLACIRRATGCNAEIYPMQFRNPLPNIRVPLRHQDKDLVLRLQELIDDCYRDGRYSGIDYGVDPMPPLKDGDAEWADALLREKGLR